MLEEPGKQQEREGRSATDKWEKTEDRTEQNLEPEAENTEGGGLCRTVRFDTRTDFFQSGIA